MKKILITGANSYIGTSFEKYINENYATDYTIDTVDMIDGSWREKSFEGYDCVLHVAGIAHQKETKQNAHIYYKVNRDLVYETAKKAIKDGVQQFVFLSSMSVYGKEEGIITASTIPMPKSDYGKSKLQAEKKICELKQNNFKIAIVRPPMVYGKDCKGNFQTIVKLVNTIPMFPEVDNKRSMIFIDNLIEFLKRIIDEEKEGVFLPQNREYVQTSHMAKCIAEVLQKRVWFSRILGKLVVFAKPFFKMVQKGFGSLVYMDTDPFKFEYVVVENGESYKRSVKRDGK